MPITALSEATVCAITSSLVLNTAVSAVKELIDNALDSHATNISIEISSNTLDTIQVKDNGSGVGLQDRQLLCKRGYTSKIRTLEDLARLGGSSLGFRGEALASIAELSESLIFTTRVEGELAGTLLKFDAKGKLVSSSSASHGTGTTVKVQNFLRAVPVRQQAALKKAPKLLADVRHLLSEYAFARPTTRLQLKILKSRSDFKGNWSYAASQDDTDLSLVASKIVGKDIVKACRHEAITSDDSRYTISALMLTNLQTRLSISDQFISIDGRPLNFDGSLMKNLHKVYRSYVKNRTADQDVLPRRLFLVVRLSCPRGSYDVNVEPAKDEVIFEDVQIVIDLFEELCKRVYGHLPGADLNTKGTPAEQRSVKQRSFDLLLARRPTAIAMGDKVSSSEKIHDMTDPNRSQHFDNNPTVNSSGSSVLDSGSEPETDRTNHFDPGNNISKHLDDVYTNSLDFENEHDLMDPQITNPFVLAKLYTRVNRNEQIQLHAHPPSPSHETFKASSHNRPSQEEGANEAVPIAAPASQAARPSDSYVDKSVDISPQMDRSTEAIDGRNSGTSPIEDHAELEAARPLSLGLSSPDTATQSVVPFVPGTPVASDSVHVQRSEPIHVSYARTAHRPAGSTTSPTSIHTSWQPFRTPFKKSTPTTNSPSKGTNTSYPTPVSGSKNIGSSHNQFRVPTRSLSTSESTSELEDIMEFENRKRDHIMQHRLKHLPTKTNRKQLETSNNDGLPNDHTDDVDVPSIISSKALYEARFRSEAILRTHDTYKQNKVLSSGAAPLSVPKDRQDLQEATTTDTYPRLPGSCSASDVAASEKHEGRFENLHASDPRAFLIRCQARASRDAQTAKLSKLKTAKMPFESINHETATHTLRVVMNEEISLDLRFLTEQHQTLHENDRFYAQSGVTQHAMTDLLEDAKALEFYKATALRTIQERREQSELSGVLSVDEEQ